MDDNEKTVGSTVPVTFRINPQDKQKFQDFSKEIRVNQAEMFDALVQSYEMSQARGTIPERGKEIDTFQDTANKMVGMFINSLAVNQSAEERIREIMSLELTTKDQTIADLQEYKKNTEDTLKLYNDKIIDLEKSTIENSKLLEKTENELEQEKVAAIHHQDQINTLTVLVTEYQEYKNENKNLESENKKLASENILAANTIEKIKSELVSEVERKDFYKEEVESVRLEIREIRNEYKENLQKIEDNQNQKEQETTRDYKQQIKEMTEEHKQQILSLKADYKAEIDKAVDSAVKIKNAEYELLLFKNDSLNNELKKLQMEENNMHDKINYLEK